MVGWLRSWLVRFLTWCLTRLVPVPPLALPKYLLPDDVLVEAARVVTEALVPIKHTGHFKRVLALKELTKQFPRRRRRELALALELAIQRLS